MGVELLDSDLYWRAPNNKAANIQRLARVDGALLAQLGASASEEFTCSVRKGKIIFHAGASMALGFGFKGTITAELNALAADEFIGCLLSLLKQSNFRRLDAFGGVDKNGVNHSFELLNDILTLALALGIITIADVVLIPIEVFSTLKRHAFQPDYAPTLAKVLDEQNPIKVQRLKKWVVWLNSFEIKSF